VKKLALALIVVAAIVAFKAAGVIARTSSASAAHVAQIEEG
jgi:hypothetical protein